MFIKILIFIMDYPTHVAAESAAHVIKFHNSLDLLDGTVKRRKEYELLFVDEPIRSVDLNVLVFDTIVAPTRLDEAEHGLLVLPGAKLTVGTTYFGPSENEHRKAESSSLLLAAATDVGFFFNCDLSATNIETLSVKSSKRCASLARGKDTPKQ
ncbi:unnamed protein product [Mycena citricolor]|uniref:Uncharacterized protein n=1 Tax=Mycena citricolor TaxID=2018698 RepID=A0AAD2JVX4_9AGAR|nr:unnamed protein product [Mycena citricolor]